MYEENDERLQKWAEILVNHSIEVEDGDEVYLLATNRECEPLFRAVRDKVIEKGGIPLEHFVYASQIGSGNTKEWLIKAERGQLERISEAKKAELEKIDKYIRIGPKEDMVPERTPDPEKEAIWKKTVEPLFQMRLKKNWATTRYPLERIAERSGMKLEELSEEIINASTADYDTIRKKNERIKRVFDEAEEIEIIDGSTKLKFSIKDREGINCHGRNNVPDGEVYYAPVKETVEGKIEFEHPDYSSGDKISGIVLTFEEGKVVDVQADENEEKMKEIVDTDEGSKFLGEFGIGTNSQRQKVIGETLMDEKIEGTIHLALGNAYDESVPEEVNSNDSSVHLDLVKDLRQQCGGGKLIADDKVIMEDGEWKIEV